MAKAYSYTRFSSLQQEAGDSYPRQRKLFEAYCQRQNLLIDDELTFHDAGDRASHPERVDARVVLRASLEAERRNEEKWLLAIEKLDDPALAIGKLNAVSARIREITAALAKAEPPMVSSDEADLVALIDALQGVGDEMSLNLRKRVQVELRRIIQRVDFNFEDLAVKVRLLPELRPDIDGVTQGDIHLQLDGYIEASARRPKR